jgi:Asp-tRNA(Asn)/Glu-tRNA(Gln) amidotransferase A subunit family amidase
MDVQEYMKYDATGLAELVASKQVTAAELLELARARAAAANPKINAIINEMGDVGDKRAAEDLSGPFAGVPFLIKDLAQEYEGQVTTFGSRSRANDVAKKHANIVQRFLDAGLVIFGKTNIPEFGAKGLTEPELFGAAHNPWKLDRTTGGSSGGSGAAVAAGIVPAAGANDGGGSIRIPAGCNGLVGLKPSRGLVPYGAITDEPLFGMVVQGVVSRTVRDSAGLLDSVIGEEASAEYLTPTPGRPFAEQIKAAPGKLRIGYSWDSAINKSPGPDAIAAVEEAVKVLSDLGHEVEQVKPPYNDDSLARDFLTIWFASLATQIDEVKDRLGSKNSEFEADSLAVAELGRANGIIKAGRALGRRHDYVMQMLDFESKYDLFLTPTMAMEPIKIGSLATPPALQKASRVIAAIHAGKALEKVSILDQMIEENLGWVPYTQLANITGRPAISVPLHWTPAGLPLGVQFIGPLGADGLLLQLAAQLEQANPWAQRHPAPLTA